MQWRNVFQHVRVREHEEVAAEGQSITMMQQGVPELYGFTFMFIALFHFVSVWRFTDDAILLT